MEISLYQGTYFIKDGRDNNYDIIQNVKLLDRIYLYEDDVQNLIQNIKYF